MRHDAQNTKSQERLLRYLRRAYSRAALPYLAVGVLLIIAVFVVGHEIEYHIKAIESWITGLGPWGLLAFIGFFILATSFLVPDTVLCIIAGALFELRGGVIVVLAGSLLGATIQYALSYKFLRSRIQRMLAAKPSLAAIQRAVSHDEFRLQILLRLTPLNPATISYILGAAGVRFSGFLVACLALTPNLIIEVYFGYVGKHATMLAGSDVRITPVHFWAMGGGAVMCVLVMLVVSRIAHRAVKQAVAGTDKA